MLVRGRSLWKKATMRLSFSPSRDCSVFSSFYVRLPLAAAERQEHSD
jgi:hypothetical protein